MENIENSRHLYLDLMKRCLLNLIYPQSEELLPLATDAGVRGRSARTVLGRTSSHKVWPPLRDAQGNLLTLIAQDRMEGRIWPVVAHTMIGLKRLDNLEFCIEQVMTNGVPGDLIETGVWRGGATIFMRAVLKAYGITDRCVWVADSFNGLPPPNPEKYPADASDPHYTIKLLAVSLDEVKSNFAKYGLLDEQVRFLPGWFCDTLPSAPIEQLAVIRLDGDMYGSTMDALTALYPKL